MVTEPDRTLYRDAGVLLVRATTYRGGDAAQLSEPSQLPETGGVERGMAWLAEVWQCEPFRCAVQVASPVLAQQVCHAVAAGAHDVRRVDRLVRSVASYLARWRGRATPFGLFAGVAVARVGDELVARWGAGHRVVVRADMQWLAAVVERLERHPGLLPRLLVVVNSAAVVRGDRLVVPGGAAIGRPEDLAPLEVSVRRSGAVRTAVRAAREPVRFAELASTVAESHPGAAPEQVRGMLAELLSHHVLISSLRAPMTVTDALGHLCEQLVAAGAGEVADLTGVVQELGAVHNALQSSRSTDGCPTGPLPPIEGSVSAAVVDRMRAISRAAAQPVTAELGLDCDIAVPRIVIREAERAASTLLRLTPYPFGHPRWKDFHARFRERYGTGVLVPVEEVVGDSGVGFPARYLGSATAGPVRVLSERDETLLALVQAATFVGQDEIVLTEPVIESLAVGSPGEMMLPPRAELAFQLHARSPAAVARGEFRIVVTAAPRSVSSMAGRFADLLPASIQLALAATFAPTIAEDPHVVAAQLSFPARRHHSENVTRTPQLLATTISIAEHRNPTRPVIPAEGLAEAVDGGAVIGLGDLAVTADARRVELVQLSTGRRVEPRVLHALEPSVLTPPLARFLAELATARCAVYMGFDWGAAARLPYLPRLRHGRSVVSPARWLLRAAELPGRSTGFAEWNSALDRWRELWHVPPAVVLCEGELRLPLDLDHRLHRELLRARLHRGGHLAQHVELREAPTAEDLSALGRAHELLLCLRPAHARDPAPRRRTPTHARNAAGHLPGRSYWLYAQVYGHPDRFDEILVDHLPGLMDNRAENSEETTRWWYRRHRDTLHPDRAQYLALYLRLLIPDRYGPAAARVGEWATDLRDRGVLADLCLATYHPEPGRFGHGDAMAAAEEVFAADSSAALAQIALARRTDLAAEAITAAGLVDLAAAFAATPGAGIQDLIDRLPRSHGRLDRAACDGALRLADPDPDRAALRSEPGGAGVAAAWDRRRTALVAYRAHLVQQQRDPGTVLRSLLHLHHVRSIGVDPERERRLLHLARTVALSMAALTRGGDGP